MDTIRFIDRLYSLIEIAYQSVELYKQNSPSVSKEKRMLSLAQQDLLETLIEEFEIGKIE